MAQREIRIPDIGDFDTISVVEVLVAKGDTIEVDQPLITLESDKASMEVPSTHAGTILEIRVAVNDEVGQDAIIMVLETNDETGITDANPLPAATDEATSTTDTQPMTARELTPEPPASEPPPPASPIQTDSPVQDAIDEAGFAGAYASPAVRRLARELGADLGRVSGTGRKGRITKEDLHNFVKVALAHTSSSDPAGAGVGGFEWPAMPDIDFARFGPVETKPLGRIRKLSARNLHRSWLHVPHVTQHDEADTTEMEAFRKAEGENAKRQGYKLTPVAFLLKAAASALRAFPEFNASLDPTGENLILKGYVNIGIAVDTPNGLVVPVIRDVDQKGLATLARELGEISGRAREKKLMPADLQGACFTISSLGGIGGTAFTPIVNAPEVAILGVSRAQRKPVWRDGAFEPRLMLPLALSYDHRVIDGAMAARFIVHLSGLLSDIRRLLL